jgi:2-hydroxychromene-2-carboxylate isomerase
MGDVIMLDHHRRMRALGRPREASRVEFFFDLSCPFSYLAAERVERAFEGVVWRPAYAAALERRDRVRDPLESERLRRAAERRAADLRLPLEWPELPGAPVPAAMRAASHAAELGRGAAFVLAASRLAFCGGFDLEDPEVLGEAAAAAGVPLDACLEAAGDARRDGPMEDTALALLAAGADRLPVLRAGRTLIAGERQIWSFVVAGGGRAALGAGR